MSVCSFSFLTIVEWRSVLERISSEGKPLHLDYVGVYARHGAKDTAIIFLHATFEVNHLLTSWVRTAYKHVHYSSCAS